MKAIATSQDQALILLDDAQFTQPLGANAYLVVGEGTEGKNPSGNRVRLKLMFGGGSNANSARYVDGSIPFTWMIQLASANRNSLIEVADVLIERLRNHALNNEYTVEQITYDGNIYFATIEFMI